MTALAGFVLLYFYDPSDIGEFGAFLALSQTIGLASNFRLDLAIHRTKSFSGATILVAYSVMVGFVISFIVFCIGISLYSFIKLPFNGTHYTLLAIAVLFVGAGQSAINYAIKIELLFRSSVTIFMLSFVTICFQFLFYKSNTINGMIVGFVLGTSVPTAVLLLSMISKISQAKLRISVLKVHLPFMFKSGLSSVVSSLANYAPLLCLYALFSDTVAGLYLIAFRLIALPTDALGQALARVFINDTSQKVAQNMRIAKNKSDSHLIYSTFQNLYMIIIVPSVSIFLCAPILSLEYAPMEWKGINLFIAPLSIIILPQFIFGVIGQTLLIRRRENQALQFQIAMFLVRLFAVSIGYVMGSEYAAILLLSLFTFAVYLAGICFVIKEFQVNGLKLLIDLFPFTLIVVVGLTMEYFIWNSLSKNAITLVIMYILTWGIILKVKSKHLSNMN
jgi:O-antigen/teichoic acid export membrane protein